MDLRADIITLGVPDLARAHEFYVDRLGWEPALAVPDEVTFLRAGPGRMIALFARAGLEGDIGDGAAAPTFDLGSLFPSAAAVDAAVDAMRAAGASVRKAPQQADWGGYHAYVEAPDGTLWELAHNPGWRVDDDCTAHIGPVDSHE
ncbi:VOC family protein [soil metagenome]